MPSRSNPNCRTWRRLLRNLRDLFDQFRSGATEVRSFFRGNEVIGEPPLVPFSLLFPLARIMSLIKQAQVLPIESSAAPRNREVGKAQSAVASKKWLLVQEGHPLLLQQVRDDHFRLRAKHVAAQSLVDLSSLVPRSAVDEFRLCDVECE